MAGGHIGNLLILMPYGILWCYLSIPGFHVSHQKLYIGVLPFSSYSHWTSTNQWYFWATKSKAGISKFMMILSGRNYHQISISRTPDYMILILYFHLVEQHLQWRAGPGLLQLSYCRLSHLFSQILGFPLWNIFCIDDKYASYLPMAWSIDTSAPPWHWPSCWTIIQHFSSIWISSHLQNPTREQMDRTQQKTMLICFTDNNHNK